MNLNAQSVNNFYSYSIIANGNRLRAESTRSRFFDMSVFAGKRSNKHVDLLHITPFTVCFLIGTPIQVFLMHCQTQLHQPKYPFSMSLISEGMVKTAQLYIQSIVVLVQRQYVNNLFIMICMNTIGSHFIFSTYNLK